MRVNFSLIVRADLIPTNGGRGIDLSGINMEQLVVNVQKEFEKAVQIVLEEKMNISGNGTCEFFGVASNCSSFEVATVSGFLTRISQ